MRHLPWRIILQPHRSPIKRPAYTVHFPFSQSMPFAFCQITLFSPPGHLPKLVIKLELRRHCQEDKFLTSSAEKSLVSGNVSQYLVLALVDSHSVASCKHCIYRGKQGNLRNCDWLNDKSTRRTGFLYYKQAFYYCEALEAQKPVKEQSQQKIKAVGLMKGWAGIEDPKTQEWAKHRELNLH